MKLSQGLLPFKIELVSQAETVTAHSGLPLVIETAMASRKGPSLVDCAGFLVMRRYRIDSALAVDPHFRQAGFTVVP